MHPVSVIVAPALIDKNSPEFKLARLAAFRVETDPGKVSVLKVEEVIVTVENEIKIPADSAVAVLSFIVTEVKVVSAYSNRIVFPFLATFELNTEFDTVFDNVPKGLLIQF